MATYRFTVILTEGMSNMGHHKHHEGHHKEHHEHHEHGSSHIKGNDRQQIDHFKSKFQGLIANMRNDVMKVNDPRAKALLETSAEAITGLKNACDDYNAGVEPAWR
jgi:G3E family GTPase